MGRLKGRDCENKGGMRNDWGKLKWEGKISLKEVKNMRD
jgi:hypothetical protein